MQREPNGFCDLEGRPFERRDLCWRSIGTDWSRLEITTKDSTLALLSEIVGAWTPPFHILYVHIVPLTEHPEGRYQSPAIYDLSDMGLFLSRFGRFLETDGRHSFWIASPATGCQAIYDRHEILYVYGDDDRVETALQRRGFESEQPRIPAPHVHHFRHELNADFDELMAYWDWVPSPLREDDDI